MQNSSTVDGRPLAVGDCAHVHGFALNGKGPQRRCQAAHFLLFLKTVLHFSSFALPQVLLQGQHSTAGAPIGAGERSSGGDHGHGGSFTSPLEVLESLTPVMAATVGILSLAWEQASNCDVGWLACSHFALLQTDAWCRWRGRRHCQLALLTRHAGCYGPTRYHPSTSCGAVSP